MSGMNYPRVIISGTNSGTGKTTVTMALLIALKKRNVSVQPYKIGPDYIDSGFLSKVSGRVCRNLDSFFFSKDVLLELFSRQAEKASFSLIEGVMGLYDGLRANAETGSTAQVSRILKSPVILLIDAGKMGASAGAIVLGYKKFDSRVNIVGCIVNRVSGPSHYEIVKRSIEKNSGVNVLGYFPKSSDFHIPERHLGLTPVEEARIYRQYGKMAKAVEDFIDVDAVIKIAGSAPALPGFKKTIFAAKAVRKKTTIAVARDESFHFYYGDNLDMLEHFGAELKFFSPLKSRFLPAGVNGVYIGGGFPEMFADKLAGNKSLREDIKSRSRQGMPIYAECGGLMYLMRGIETADKNISPMVGVFPGTVRMGDGLRLFGYYDVKAVRPNVICDKGTVTKGHVFHWSYVTGVHKRMPCVFRLEKGRRAFYDGYMKDNTLAGYLHVHFGANPVCAKKFVESCFEYKKKVDNGGK